MPASVFNAGARQHSTGICGYPQAGDFNAQLAENVFFRLVGVYRESGTQVDRVNDDATILMPSISYDNGTTRLTAMVEYSDRDSDTSSQFLPLTGTGCVSGDVTITPEIVCANANGQEIKFRLLRIAQRLNN